MLLSFEILVQLSSANRKEMKLTLVKYFLCQSPNYWQLQPQLTDSGLSDLSSVLGLF